MIKGENGFIFPFYHITNSAYPTRLSAPEAPQL